MKLNDKEELVCVKSGYDFKEGERYKFRFDDPDSIYVYYPISVFLKTHKVGVRFSIIKYVPIFSNSDVRLSTTSRAWGLDFYKSYFCTIREQRKMKLEKLKINNL
jgi:hypothetical protein